MVIQRIVGPPGSTDIHWAFAPWGGGGFFTQLGAGRSASTCASRWRARWGPSSENASDVATSAFFSYGGRPQILAGMRMGGGGNWDGKIDAVANILEELTGIPFDLIKDFFAAELFDLAYLIKS